MIVALLLLAAASAAPATPGVIQARASDAYGKPVPDAAICTARPDLGATFRDDVTVVGIRQGTKGCQLYGVMVGSRWIDAPDALPESLATDAWSDQGGRPELVRRWTERVLLAFDQHESSEVADLVVRATFVQRATRGDTRYLTRRTDGVFTFDEAGRLTNASRENGPWFRTQFSVRESQLDEHGPKVMGALGRSGKDFRECFEAAFERDLTVAGRVRIAFEVRGGKATRLTMMDDGDQVDVPLTQCYANAVGRTPFPPDLSASATMGFHIRRGSAD